MNKLNFVFLGGEPLSVPTLETLYKNGLVPGFVACNPDKPAGRNLEFTPPPTKLWAIEHNVPFVQPEKPSIKDFGGDFDLLVVVAYGKIIPKEILDSAKYGAINIHPSLLPKYRGPSPMISAILNGDTETGVTIIKIDEQMDHGPILAQEKINLSGNELVDDLEKSLAELGGKLLVEVILKLPEVKEKAQDHNKATFVKKFNKQDAEIKLDGDPLENWRKFRAFHNNLRTFFFKNGKRIIITDAAFQDGKFVIKKVIPEGGKEIDFKR
jgi:methionyl-tRNA formyltransferase